MTKWLPLLDAHASGVTKVSYHITCVTRTTFETDNKHCFAKKKLTLMMLYKFLFLIIITIIVNICKLLKVKKKIIFYHRDFSHLRHFFFPFLTKVPIIMDTTIGYTVLNDITKDLMHEIYNNLESLVQVNVYIL